MPIYQYLCPACGEVVERLVTADKVTKCTCGAVMTKQPTCAAVKVK